MCCDFEHSPFFRITLQYQSNNTVLMLAFSNGSNITPTNRLNTPKRKKRTQGHPSYTSANYFWQKLAMSTISHYAKKHALSHRWTRVGFFISKSHTNQVSTTGASEWVNKSNQSICLWSSELEKAKLKWIKSVLWSLSFGSCWFYFKLNANGLSWWIKGCTSIANKMSINLAFPFYFSRL